MDLRRTASEASHTASKPSLRYEFMQSRKVTLAQIKEEIRTHEKFCRQIKGQAMKSSFHQCSFFLR